MNIALTRHQRAHLLIHGTPVLALGELLGQGAQGEYDTLNGLLKELGYKLPESGATTSASWSSTTSATSTWTGATTASAMSGERLRT